MGRNYPTTNQWRENGAPTPDLARVRLIADINSFYAISEGRLEDAFFIDDGSFLSIDPTATTGKRLSISNSIVTIY